MRESCTIKIAQNLNSTFVAFTNDLIVAFTNDFSSEQDADTTLFVFFSKLLCICLRCLSTVFSGPYQTFSFGRLANFPDSNRCKIYTRYWNWIEV